MRQRRIVQGAPQGIVGRDGGSDPRIEGALHCKVQGKANGRGFAPNPGYHPRCRIILAYPLTIR